jgi:coenzyme F420-reducing hydrogenase alpha subunit
LARGAAESVGLTSPVTNPFRSIVVRAIELVEACDEALRIVATYDPPEPAFVSLDSVKGVGVGATEAPRGLLLHRYEIDATGVITAARIVPPTSQNQATIEADLRRVVEDGLALDDDALTSRCEQAVRNHDPCISCAAHFLDVKVARR